LAAPTAPTAALGSPDITFANAVEGAVTVEVAASNVPMGTTVNIRVVPATGAPTTAVTSGLTGASVADTTAQASVTLPPGAGVVTATATFNVGGGGVALNSLPLIDGERPTQVEVMALADGTSRAYYVTPSGRRREMTSPLQ
jgi:hypothetical protein